MIVADRSTWTYCPKGRSNRYQASDPTRVPISIHSCLHQTFNLQLLARQAYHRCSVASAFRVQAQLLQTKSPTLLPAGISPSVFRHLPPSFRFRSLDSFINHFFDPAGSPSDQTSGRLHLSLPRRRSISSRGTSHRSLSGQSSSLCLRLSAGRIESTTFRPN